MQLETFNFTNDFQDAILACLIRFPDEFYAFGEIIKAEYFDGPAAAETVLRLIEYKQTYGKYPNFSTLGNFAFDKAVRVNGDHAKEVIAYVQKVAEIDTSDKDAILALSIKFARERAIDDGVKRIYAAKADNDKKIDPVKIMEEAVAIGTNYSKLGFSLYHHSDDVLDKVMQKNYGVRTGFDLFDQIWQFGWAPGWLIILLAPPKRFKTAMSINLALNIVSQQDVDVLYYACEISEELAGLRAITNVTGWSQEQLAENLERGKIITKTALQKQLWGTIWFKGFPSKSVTISEIRSHAKQVISLYNLKPKAIIIDYAETVRPDTVNKNVPDWRQQADIYTQARALGSDLGCAVIMPDRCKAETVGRTVPSMNSFQGSFEKAGIVDAAIGICATDEEYMQGRIRYFVFLNRHGEAYQHFEGKVDKEHMKLTVDRKIEYKPDEDEEEDSKLKRPKGGYKRKPKPPMAGTELTQRD